MKPCELPKKVKRTAQKFISGHCCVTVSKEGERMTAFIQIFLWAFLLFELSELISPIMEILRRRMKLRRLVKANMKLSENADSDYIAGFFYGKAKRYEKELKETRYFDYD